MLHLRDRPGIWGRESKSVAGPWLGPSRLSVQECSLLMQFTSSFGCGLGDSWSLSLPQVDLALFLELCAQGVTWSYETQLFWAGESCLGFFSLHLLS